ncbi:MAG TPA: hypothetical protein VN523_14010 [Hyphomicrobiaceae bacterium]|jgi:hypothetical protein|nr:hypothetical protein [Hyphomicrobiaceae bacterium]
MLQAAPQFSPFQLLEAGRRAEAEGHIDAAYQYYRQTVDQFAYSAEAAQAREGLARLNGGRQPNIWHLNGTPQANDGASRWNGAARKARRHKLPTPRNHYRVSSFLAGLVSLLGSLMVAAGLAAAPLHLALGRPEIGIGSGGVLTVAVALAALGLVTVAFGQAVRALFDQANATRELVAIERAKAGVD